MSGVRHDLKDAVTPRAFILVIGVLVLQLGFILSYVGAFHDPKPQHISVGLVAPAAQSSMLADRLSNLDGTPLAVHVVAGEDLARRQIADGDLSAALVVNPSGTSDRLLTASGGGASVVTAVQAVLDQVERSQHRTVTTTAAQ